MTEGIGMKHDGAEEENSRDENREAPPWSTVMGVQLVANDPNGCAHTKAARETRVKTVDLHGTKHCSIQKQ